MGVLNLSFAKCFIGDLFSLVLVHLHRSVVALCRVVLRYFVQVITLQRALLADLLDDSNEFMSIRGLCEDCICNFVVFF